MFKDLLKSRREKGFTIIEVLIVLAIAGLILVIVLVAVPQLQRNQRNEARRNDAARVSTAVSNWMTNNNGTPLPTANPAKDAALNAIIADLGVVSQYSFTASSTLNTVAGAATVAANTNLNNVVIVMGAKCGTSGVATSTGAASRQFAVQYASETSGGTPTGQCIEV